MLSPGRSASLVILAFAALVPSASAQTGIIPIGSPLTFGGTNTPDTFSDTVIFSSTPAIVDSGKVKIWQQQVPTGPNGEWDIFYMETTGGGTIAGNINAYWAVVMNYQVSQAAFFDGVVMQWLANGTPFSPLTNGIGSICCAAASNPILPGYSYYNTGFSGPIAAGTVTGWQQVFVTPYNIVSNGGVNPNTANGFVFALHFTLQQPAVQFTTTLATNFVAEPFAPEAIVTAFGSDLSVDTKVATTIPLPNSLAGSSITIVDSAGMTFLAPLYYVSPLQVNYEIPPGIANGAATVTLKTDGGTTQTETIQIAKLSPGLFALNTSGLVAAWVLPIVNGVQQSLQPVYQVSGSDVVSLPINVADPSTQTYLELYGTGIRSAASVTVTVGGVSVPVLFAGAAPGNVGEDQVNIGPLPASLAGRGKVDIILTADGTAAQTVNVTIQ
jgi:uncharacterized protein (TIGR03437 family)